MSAIFSRVGPPRYTRHGMPGTRRNSEARIERALFERIASWGVESIARQVKVGPRLIADIVYRASGVVHVVEIKAVPVRPRDVLQLNRYVEALRIAGNALVIGVLAAPSMRSDVDLRGSGVIFIELEPVV